MNESIYKAQLLLYKWLTHFERKSYNSIKDTCEYLNKTEHLDIQGNPIWKLFFPLVLNGVIDYAGKDYYSVTDPLVLNFKNHSYLINGGSSNADVNLPIGYQLLQNDHYPQITNRIRMSSLAVLKSFPSINSIIEGWNDSIQDETILEYHNSKTRIGIAEINNGTSRYFSIPKECLLKEIPSRSINPDAYNIGIYYERVANNRINGKYNRAACELKLYSHGIPFVLYRALMIDGLEKQLFPKKEKEVYVFYNISKVIVKELNRILCNSISYE